MVWHLQMDGGPGREVLSGGRPQPAACLGGRPGPRAVTVRNDPGGEADMASGHMGGSVLCGGAVA